MLQGGETWTSGKRKECKLISKEVDFWWRAARKSRKEKIRNLKIREIMNAKHYISEAIEKKTTEMV
jgi:hypothetical protein